MWISLYQVTNNIFSYYCYAIIPLYFLLITIYINIATVRKKSCLLCRFRNFYYIRYITTLTRSWFSLCLFVLIFVISRWKCGRSLNDFALLTMSCDRSLQLHTYKIIQCSLNSSTTFSANLLRYHYLWNCRGQEPRSVRIVFNQVRDWTSPTVLYCFIAWQSIAGRIFVIEYSRFA